METPDDVDPVAMACEESGAPSTSPLESTASARRYFTAGSAARRGHRGPGDLMARRGGRGGGVYTSSKELDVLLRGSLCTSELMIRRYFAAFEMRSLEHREMQTEGGSIFLCVRLLS